MSSGRNRLRILTYMCPEIPSDIFMLVRDYLEEATGHEVDLMIENRFHGPVSGRADPFEEDLADIVIVYSTNYLKMRAAGHADVELCGAALVHQHLLAAERPVYFSEIIIHAANKEKYKDIKDLKGCSWAYTDELSLSGNLVVLNFLKKTLKTNAAYFGSIVQSGSHLNSIKMVRDYQVDAAAVDSSVLAGYLREHEDHTDKFMSLVSLGPLPVYPFLFNKKLSADMKQKVTNALLSMHQAPKWAVKLADLGLQKFAPVDPNLYSLEKDIQEYVSGMKINTTYY